MPDQRTGHTDWRVVAALLAATLVAANVSRAQVVRGVLVSAADGVPVPYGTVLGPDSTARFTDAEGRFSLGSLAAGRYTLRARMLGYSPLDTTVAVDSTRAPIVLRLQPVAIRLATVPVTAKRNPGCVATGIANAKDPQLAAVFAQLNLNVDRYNLLLDKYPFRYLREETEFVRTNFQNSTSDSTLWMDTVEYDSRDRRPYTPGHVVFTQASQHGTDRTLMYLPTFRDLADSAFDAAHCFAYMGQRKNEIRIDFRPADRIAAPDVDGSVYLDAKRYIVRRATFELTKPNLLDPPVVGLTVTTTFKEVVPLVPIFGETITDQPLRPMRTTGIDPGTLQYHPMVLRTVIEQDHVLSHEFIGDTIGSLTRTVPPPRVAQAPPSAPTPPIMLSCTMPPSFETTDIAIYGTLSVDGALGPHSDKVLAAVRHQFRLPDNVTLPVYGYAFNRKVAPTVTGVVAFTLDAAGHVTETGISATSLTTAVDTTLVQAVRSADSAHAFPSAAAGHYTLSLSSAMPATGAQAAVFASVSVAVEPLAHNASIDLASPPPSLPAGNGTFEFVVDERGRPLPKTMRTVSTSSPRFAQAVALALNALRFEPAITGTCPIKQVVMQPFQATLTNARP